MVKQLEGLFAELSAAVYGLPLLLWRVGRSPVHGALRLAVRHRRAHDAHIGPNSAVLIAALLLTVWSGQADRIREFADGLIAGGPGLIEPVVTALLLASLVDGGCRLYTRIRFTHDVRRRARASALLLYASAFAILTIGPFFWAALLASTTLDQLGLPRGAVAGFLFVILLYAAAFAASWPTIAVYNALRRSPEQRPALGSALPFAYLGVFMVAPIVGGGFVRWIQTPPVRLSSPYATCTIDADGVGVVAVLHNHTRDVMIVDSRNLGVRLLRDRQFISQFPLEVVESSAARAGGLITIPPDAVALVEATADPLHPRRIGNDLSPEMRPDRCGLAKMNDRRPLWLGESGAGSFSLLPDVARLLEPLEPWPDSSQDTFEGTGVVIDRRSSSRPRPAGAQSP